MPVTAKFSEAFYERLGHDIVGELVEFLNQIDGSYKSELRELNELNYQRFDAKVEQRFAEADAKLERRFAEAEVKVEKRFAELDGRLERSTGELRREMAQLESKLIRWMFVFWAGSTFTILGTMVALLKL